MLSNIYTASLTERFIRLAPSPDVLIYYSNLCNFLTFFSFYNGSIYTLLFTEICVFQLDEYVRYKTLVDACFPGDAYASCRTMNAALGCMDKTIGDEYDSKTGV